MAEEIADRPLVEARRRAVRRLGFGLLAHSTLSAFGVAGYMSMGWSFLDAIYMVIITVSTVGFGEVRPVDSVGLRIHTMVLIVVGTVTLTYIVASLVQLVTEGEIQRILGHQRVKRQIDQLRDHVIVAGMGRMGLLIAAELGEAGVPFLIVERLPERLPELQAREWLFVLGDATEEEVLREAGLDRARALVTVIPNDAVNVFITLTAREMAPKVRILARAEQPSTEKKLIQAGADHVVLPAAIGASRAVTTLLNPGAIQLTELVTRNTGLAFEIAEVSVEPGSPFSGRTLRDADVGRRTGAMILAVKRADGPVDFPPRSDEPLRVGDGILLLGRRENLERFRELFPQA